MSRNSHQRCSIIKGVLKILTSYLFYRTHPGECFSMTVDNIYKVNPTVFQTSVDKCWKTDLSNPSLNFQNKFAFSKEFVSTH